MNNIIINFSGGRLDNMLLASKSDGDRATVEHYYALSGGGEIGRHFAVPDGCGGFDLYGVVRRIELGNGVIVRATYIGYRPNEETETT